MSEIRNAVTLVVALFFVVLAALVLYVLVQAYVWVISHPEQMKPWYIGGGVASVILALIFIFFVGAHAWEGWQSKRLDNRHKREHANALKKAIEQKANIKMTPDRSLEIIHWLPQMRAASVQEEPQKMLPAPEEPSLPGPCDFADILDSWRPSQQQILLALGPGGQPVTVPVKGLCHVALAGATGLGKSNLMRLLIPQLLFVGARVILADPHFAPVDVESDEDWRPIANRLMMDPAIAYPAIKDVLAWLSTKELVDRLERRRKMEQIGEPIFLAIDELPAIVKHVPEAPEYMADLLREGRKVGLYLVSAAQDWLVKTVGGTGAVRDCFRTAFYVGGDATSARVLLDVKGTVDDGGLGKGLVMLRSQATPKASLIRVPYASNEALDELLTVRSTARPTATITAFPTARMSSFPTDEGALAVDAMVDSIPTYKPQLDARSIRIRELLKDKTSTSKIIEEIWGVSARQGGTAYKKAANELSEIIAELFQGEL